MQKEKTAKQTVPKRAGDNKGRKQAVPQTAQQTIPFREMFKDGVCRLNNGVYTKTVAFEDINYQLAQAEDQSAIFDGAHFSTTLTVPCPSSSRLSTTVPTLKASTP